MALIVLVFLFSLIAAVSAAFVFAHAFRRSVGTGLMVLCIPFFIVYYAFDQFEHRHKGLIVAGLVGASLLAVLLRGLAGDIGVPVLPPQPGLAPL
jgi:hypothetical protein